MMFWREIAICFICIITYASTSGCIPGWLRYGDSCYLFSRHRASWFDAEQRCTVLYGAKLAEIESEAEDTFLRIHLIDQPHHDNLYWIGGTDAQQEGHWIWIKDRKLVSFSAWRPNQPDNWHGNEHCMEMQGPEFKWNDDDCNELRSYICEEETS